MSFVPAPSGSAGAAHFSGARSLAARARADALRAQARIDAARIDAAGKDGASDQAAPGFARAQPAPLAAPRPAAGPRVAGPWPRPPACLTAARLAASPPEGPPQGARVAAAGLVIVRQRPGSAKGVLFVTLEDETGVVNVVVWAKVYERFRRAVLAGRLLRVTGRVQREGPVVHLVAETIEDLSPLLDALAEGRAGGGAEVGAASLAPADEVRRPLPQGSRPPAGGAAARAQGLVRGAAPRALHPREQSKLLFRTLPGAGDAG